jgi:hypothetical protein
VFLDFAIPLLVVGTHLGIDKILEWRQHGIAHQAVA